MSASAESLRIHNEAQAICQPFQILVTTVDALPGSAGGGFAVTIWLPRHIALDGPEVREVREQLEAINGVTRVWVLLAPSTD